MTYTSDTHAMTAGEFVDILLELSLGLLLGALLVAAGHAIYWRVVVERRGQ